MAEDLSARIDAVAAGPASASQDGMSVSEQSLSQLIEADKYRKATDAANNRYLGIRFRKVRPPASA